MKLCVYTCIVNDYDNLIEVEPQEGVDYYCYMSGVQKAYVYKGWNIIPLVREYENHRMTNRFHKINTELLPEVRSYEYSLYVDGSITLKKTPEELLELIGSKDILLMKHWVRNCPYKEAEVVKESNLDSKERVEATIKYLEDNKYPKNKGLHCGGLVMRKKSKKTNYFNEGWMYGVTKYSIRDQLTLDLNLKNSDMKVEEVEKDEVCYIRGHKK